MKAKSRRTLHWTMDNTRTKSQVRADTSAARKAEKDDREKRIAALERSVAVRYAR